MIGFNVFHKKYGKQFLANKSGLHFFEKNYYGAGL